MGKNPRLSPAWKLNLAVAYAAKGELDQAATAVEQAYAADPNLKDGYARVGWQVFWEKKDYAQAAEWIEKDLSTNYTNFTKGTIALCHIPMK